MATVFDHRWRSTALSVALATAPPGRLRRRRPTPGLGGKHRYAARQQVITVARSSPTTRQNAGKSMVIIGAAMNHWYHCRHELPRRHQPADDVRLHRPKRRRLGALRRSGKAAPADRLDCRWPSRWTGSVRRAQNGTSFFYATPTSGATKARMEDITVAIADPGLGRQHDRLQRARRAHGLAALPRRSSRPTRCRWSRMQRRRPGSPKDYVVAGQDGRLSR